MQAHHRYFRGFAAACLTAAVAACQAAGEPDTGRRESAVQAPDARTPDRPPTGATSAPTPAGGTEGPHEGTRGSAPPGTTRDGLPPDGGTITDPTGAATGSRPPPGIR